MLILRPTVHCTVGRRRLMHGSSLDCASRPGRPSYRIGTNSLANGLKGEIETWRLPGMDGTFFLHGTCACMSVHCNLYIQYSMCVCTVLPVSFWVVGRLKGGDGLCCNECLVGWRFPWLCADVAVFSLLHATVLGRGVGVGIGVGIVI